MMSMGKLIGIGVVILLTLLVLFFVERHGYNRCADEDKLALTEQKLTDVKAVAEIKGFKKSKAKENERVKKAIKKLPDPTGCAKSPITTDRVNRMFNALNRK